MKTTRRSFIHQSSAAGLLMMMPGFPLRTNSLKKVQIAVQQYTCFSYLRREDFSWDKDLEASFSQLEDAGLLAFEPSFLLPNQVEKVEAIMGAKKMWSKSMYVNSTLHLEEKVEASLKNALAIAKNAQKMGIEIVVTNPSPIAWGQDKHKTDKQLITQAKALDQLGASLRGMGMKLAYHTHDIEMRKSAREFHHMLLNTDPANVHLCLDAHWVYRGAGDSQVALFDIINMYGDRMVELHIRQSTEGIWSEVFGEGDIDYGRLGEVILSKKLSPHLVLEQAVEEGSPQSMKAMEAISKSFQNAQDIFQDFAK